MTNKIAELNDLCRKAPGLGGKMVVTRGIASLPSADQSAIIEHVQKFNDFNEDNDPHGEHDFGSFTFNGTLIFWKIDYYYRSLENGSEDPSDPSKTTRVLTIMLSSEY